MTQWFDMLYFAHSPNKILHLRLCMVDCLVKMVSHWKTSGRSTGTDSLQTQVGLDSRCTVSFKTGLKKPPLKRETGTFQHLPPLFHRSHVWPALVRSTASGQFPPTQYLILLFWIWELICPLLSLSLSLSCRMAVPSASGEWVVSSGLM